MELLCILRPAHTKGAPIDDFMAPGQAFCTIQFAREKNPYFFASQNSFMKKMHYNQG